MPTERGALAMCKAGAGKAFVTMDGPALLSVRGHPSLSCRYLSLKERYRQSRSVHTSILPNPLKSLDTQQISAKFYPPLQYLPHNHFVSPDGNASGVALKWGENRRFRRDADEASRPGRLHPRVPPWTLRSLRAGRSV